MSYKIQVTNAVGTNRTNTGYVATSLAGAVSVARCIACDDTIWHTPVSPVERLKRLVVVDSDNNVIIREIN